MGFLCTFIATLLNATVLLNAANSARLYSDNCRCLRGNYDEHADPRTGAVAMVCNDTVESATRHFEHDLHVDRSTVHCCPLTDCPSTVGLKAKDASSKIQSGDNRYQKHEDGPVPSLTLSTDWKHVRKMLSDPGAMGESTPILHSLSKVSTSKDTIDNLPSAPGFHSFWQVPTGPNAIDEPLPTPVFPSSWKLLPIPKSLEEPPPAPPVLDFLGKVPNAPGTVLNKLSTTPAVSSVFNAPFAPRNDLPEVLAHLGSGHATRTFKNVRGMIKKRTGLIPVPRSLREVPSGPDIPPPHAYSGLIPVPRSLREVPSGPDIPPPHAYV